MNNFKSYIKILQNNFICLLDNLSPEPLPIQNKFDKKILEIAFEAIKRSPVLYKNIIEYIFENNYYLYSDKYFVEDKFELNYISYLLKIQAEIKVEKEPAPNGIEYAFLIKCILEEKASISKLLSKSDYFYFIFVLKNFINNEDKDFLKITKNNSKLDLSINHFFEHSIIINPTLLIIRLLIENDYSYEDIYNFFNSYILQVVKKIKDDDVRILKSFKNVYKTKKYNKVISNYFEKSTKREHININHFQSSFNMNEDNFNKIFKNFSHIYYEFSNEMEFYGHNYFEEILNSEFNEKIEESLKETKLTKLEQRDILKNTKIIINKPEKEIKIDNLFCNFYFQPSKKINLDYSFEIVIRQNEKEKFRKNIGKNTYLYFMNHDLEPGSYYLVISLEFENSIINTTNKEFKIMPLSVKK